MPSGLKKLDRILDKFEENVVGIATLAMVLVIFINVVLRNFFSTSLPWGNEVSSYLNVLAVYIAVGAGFKYGTHVGVSVVVDNVFPKKWRKGIDVITEVFVLIFCGMGVVFAIRMAMLQMHMGQVSAVLRMPLWIIYGIIMVGMILSCIRVIMNIVRIIKDDKIGNETDRAIEELEANAEKTGGEA